MDSISKYIGMRVRFFRKERGLSREKLAESLGVTVSQIHKYETGINKISASNLYIISVIFQVPLNLFFVDKGLLKPALGSDEIPEILQAFRDIENPQVRAEVLKILRTIADGTSQQRDVSSSDFTPQVRLRRRVR